MGVWSTVSQGPGLLEGATFQDAPRATTLVDSLGFEPRPTGVKAQGATVTLEVQDGTPPGSRTLLLPMYQIGVLYQMTRGACGARWRDRTSDLHRVVVLRYRCAKRACFQDGGTGEFRDLDLLGFNQTLCQLSYRTMVVPPGFEPDPSVLHAEMLHVQLRTMIVPLLPMFLGMAVGTHQDALL